MEDLRVFAALARGSLLFVLFCNWSACIKSYVSVSRPKIWKTIPDKIRKIEDMFEIEVSEYDLNSDVTSCGSTNYTCGLNWRDRNSNLFL